MRTSPLTDRRSRLPWPSSSVAGSPSRSRAPTASRTQPSRLTLRPGVVPREPLSSILPARRFRAPGRLAGSRGTTRSGTRARRAWVSARERREWLADFDDVGREHPADAGDAQPALALTLHEALGKLNPD